MTDYDLTDIPAGYDRARDHGPGVLWMRTVVEYVDDYAATRILDYPFITSPTGRPPSTSVDECFRKKGVW